MDFMKELIEMIERYAEGEIDGYELGDWVYNHRDHVYEIHINAERLAQILKLNNDGIQQS